MADSPPCSCARRRDSRALCLQLSSCGQGPTGDGRRDGRILVIRWLKAPGVHDPGMFKAEAAPHGKVGVRRAPLQASIFRTFCRHRSWFCSSKPTARRSLPPASAFVQGASLLDDRLGYQGASLARRAADVELIKWRAWRENAAATNTLQHASSVSSPCDECTESGTLSPLL